MFTDIVLLKCKECGVTLECVYEPEELATRNHPGEPGFWYSTNETETLLDDYDTIMEHGEPIYCDHEGLYSKEDFDDFQIRCGVIAQQSFEITQDDY